MSHSVLLPDFNPEDLASLAKPVAAVYRVLPMDAQARLRRGWGFLERDATPERATQIVDHLAAHGVRAIAVDNTVLRETKEPAVLLSFAVTPDGLLPTLQSPDAVPQVIPWTELAIVAAGGFSEETMRREAAKSTGKGPSMVGIGIFLVTGIPVGLFGGGRGQTDSKPAKTTRFLSFGQMITARNEAFFFNPDHFDFTGLGSAKQVNASLNFRLFLALLAQRSSARLNLGARCLLGNRSLSLANYQSLHDFETELRWMLNTGPA